MSAHIRLTTASGWHIFDTIPCASGFHAMVRVSQKYPGCKVNSVELVEAAHA